MTSHARSRAGLLVVSIAVLAGCPQPPAAIEEQRRPALPSLRPASPDAGAAAAVADPTAGPGGNGMQFGDRSGAPAGSAATTRATTAPGGCATPAPDSVTTLATAADGLKKPAGVAVDRAGRIYVSSWHGQKIVGLSRDAGCRWKAVTIAGDGVNGLQDGPATQARFNDPRGLALSPDGQSLFVADFSNHRIRRIDLAASPPTVETYAGRGVGGFADGPAGQAIFDHPTALAVAANGDVYVADSYNHRIRRIAESKAGRVVSTVFGGPGQLNMPAGVALAVDRAGPRAGEVTAIYVADTGNNRVVRHLPSPSASPATRAIAGHADPGFEDGSGAAARFKQPLDLAYGAGALWLIDGQNQAVRRLTLLDQDAAAVRTLAGDTGVGDTDGPLATARFRYPLAIAVTAEGDLVVADGDNDRVRLITRRRE